MAFFHHNFPIPIFVQLFCLSMNHLGAPLPLVAYEFFSTFSVTKGLFACSRSYHEVFVNCQMKVGIV